MKFVSILTEKSWEKELEIQLWPENDEAGYDVATIWLAKEKSTLHKTFVELRGSSVHRFCEPENPGASRCQFSPTGYCRPSDLLPGSQSNWSNKWNDLRTYWRFTVGEQLFNVISVASVNITWFGVDGRQELLRNIRKLER